MYRWAVRKGYVRASPFAAIQPVGRPSRGKQLRFEEAERFHAEVCQRCATCRLAVLREPHEMTALGLCLMLAWVVPFR